jgi:acetolactate synthase-1/2/3 large subunit
MIKLSDYIMEFLAEYGVTHIFMVAGGGAMHLDDSLGKCKKITPVCCLHEQAAAIAAQASAQAGAKIGVAIVTTGPGGTNAITGVAAAWVDSAPLLIISGQVKRSAMIGQSGLRQRGSQELNIVPVIKTITKYSVCVLEPERIREYLEKAIFEGTHGRPGPVWLDIPLDVQASMIDEKSLKGFQPGPEDNPNFDINTIVQLWNDAKRPVILAGHGIELSNAQNEFRQLVEKVKAPVLTTWRSIGLIGEDNECFCGRPGGIAQRGANIVQQKADLILSIGCRLDGDQVGFNYSGFAKNAKKIIVDVDEAELGKFSEMVSTILVKTNAKDLIEQLLPDNQLIPADQKWRLNAREIYQKYPVMQPEYRNHEIGVNIYHLDEILSQLSAPSDVISPGNSAGAPNCIFQTWHVKEGQKFICAAGFGSMGFGIPSAMGSAIANPASRVICVNGDGGWQLNTQELETIRRFNLNIKFFVLNNDGYASIRNMQRNYFEGRYIGCNPDSGLTLPNTLKVAEAYGINNLYLIKSGDEVEAIVEKVLNSQGPAVCEVMVTPEQIYAPRLVSKIVNGNFVTPTMEILWPELSEVELKTLLSNDW